MRSSRFSLTVLPIAATVLTAVALFPGGASAEGVIHSFIGGATDGSNPIAGLVAGNHGTLYGTTYNSGEYGFGTVFEMAISGGVWTETVLHSFAGEPDGSGPAGPLIFDQGRVYGTTSGGGSYGLGTVFELTPPNVSGGAWTETVLYSFKTTHGAVVDGAHPYGGLVVGWDGFLYGTTSQGGASGEGIIFRVRKLKTGTWSETVIHSFSGSSSDGDNPNGSLIADKAGNLYGTTNLGGSETCTFFGALAGCGTVFEVSPPPVLGEPWTETILYNFAGASAGDGSDPTNTLVFDDEGNLYGTTYFGGEAGDGTIFELSPAAGGGWTESVLYSFTGGRDGANPYAAVVFDSAGNLYGTAYAGGSPVCSCGTVFKLSPPSTSDGAWSETTLHEFDVQAEDDGGNPQCTLVFSKYGALHGTTQRGGVADDGTVFSIQP